MEAEAMGEVQEVTWRSSQQPEDQRAHARFYKKAVHDKKASLEAGMPKCVVRDFVEILTPGDRTNIVDRPARDEDRARFPKQWAAYQNNVSQEAAAGMPLSAWGHLSAERVEWYRFYKVSTVEQLADLSDAAFANLDPGSRKESEAARGFLSATKAAAPMQQMQAELQERDKRIAALEALLLGGKPAEAKPLVTDLSTPEEAPKKRGRPAKQKAEVPQ